MIEEFLGNFVEALRGLIPLLLIVALLSFLLWFINRLLKKNKRLGKTEGQFSQHLIMLGVTALGILLCLLSLPVETATKNNLLTVFGLVLTAIITLSSTTFAANAMAGLMLRSIKHFRPGDFIRVADQFGRVTERGLFHTEIQTEDRDLTSIPNMFLIQHPVNVVHETGTMVSATVSLGYDVSVNQIEPLLIQAAERAGLEDPFLHIRELGDFSITYRIAGFLKDVKTLISIRSKLRREMLSSLHHAGIEIASPSIMIQRPLKPGDRLIPVAEPESTDNRKSADSSSEKLVFDKAEKAGKLEELRKLHDDLTARAEGLKKQIEGAEDESKLELETELVRVQKRLAGLESVWDTVEERLKS